MFIVTSMQMNGAVTATRVFADAVRMSGTSIARVQKLNGANSVWLATGDNSNLVFKYLDSSHHGHSHFDIEDNFFRLNSCASFLPQILFRDPASYLLVMPFLERKMEPEVKLNQLIAVINDDFPNLQVPMSAHNSPPGILSWWRNGEMRFSLGEKLVIDAIRRYGNLSRSLGRVEEEWSQDVTIHGDPKLANVIIGASDFWFIDWESVSMGIKEWDIAGLLQSCIAEVVIEGPLSPWVIESSSELKAALNNGNDLLLDCVASRLMQSAVELSQGAQSIPPWAVDLLQAADDITRRRFEGLWNLMS